MLASSRRLVKLARPLTRQAILTKRGCPQADTPFLIQFPIPIDQPCYRSETLSTLPPSCCHRYAYTTASIRARCSFVTPDPWPPSVFS